MAIIMEKLDDTCDAIITTFLMLTTEIENGACSVESRDSPFYHYPFPPPSMLMFLARFLTTLLRSTLR